MDMVLARTFSIRPENKIVMRCPSLPNSPLHQYFGAKKPKRKDKDFIFSSLGYVRLYECCCPREACDQQSDSGIESSFVHLEERLRSDGPFVPYRRPPPRRLGLGLTERAREKRLLKYYKYFQGFQRKLQVSRQFQQTSQKPQNKAKVKKIINYYKPNATSLPETSTTTTTVTATAATLPVNLQQESTTSREVLQKVTAPVATGKTMAKIKKDPVLNKRLADMATVLASIDTNANKFHKKKERCTVIAPTLETIQENSGDCEISESEQNVATDKQQIQATPDLINNKQSKTKMVQQSKSNCKSDDLTHPRGILKQPVQTNKKIVPKNQSPEDETSNTPKPAVTDSKDSQPVKKQRKVRKPTSVRKTSSDSVNNSILASSVGSEGQLEIKDGTLKKEVSLKVSRGHPALMRSSNQSRTSSVSRVSIQQDEPPVVVSDVHIEQSASEAKQVEVTESHSQKSVSWKALKKRKSSAFKSKSGHGRSSVRFTGWDYGTSLQSHAMQKLPEEKDLLEQLLKRAESSQWAVNPHSVILDNIYHIPPEYDTRPEDPKAYLQKHDILGVFSNFTKELVNVKPHGPFDLLQELAHDLAMQHEQKMGILNDLRAKKEKSTIKSSSKITGHKSSTKSLHFSNHMQPINDSDMCLLPTPSKQEVKSDTSVGHGKSNSTQETEQQESTRDKTVSDCPICDAVAGSLFVDIGKSQGSPDRYYMSYLSLNSNDAKYACKRVGGYLAEMDTPTELKLVTSGLEGLVYNEEDIHIGGKINKPSGTISSSVRPSQRLFVDWQAWEPNGPDGDRCVTLNRRSRGRGIKMNDCNCTTLITRFLCEV